MTLLLLVYLLWMQLNRHTRIHDRHSNCSGIMSDEYPPHKKSVPRCEGSQTRILTHYNLPLPWPPPPPSSNSLPFYLSHPCCSSFSFSVSLSSIASSFFSLFPPLVGVSKQLKHLQGVTLGPHAPPNVVSAGGWRQRWKGECFIRLFSPCRSAWHWRRECG